MGERNRGREVQGAHSQVGPGQRHGSSGGSEAEAGDNQGSQLGLKGHCYVDGTGPEHGRARAVGVAVLVAAAVMVWQGRQCRAGLGGGSAGHSWWRTDIELLGRGKAFWNYDQKMRPPLCLNKTQKGSQRVTGQFRY